MAQTIEMEESTEAMSVESSDSFGAGLLQKMSVSGSIGTFSGSSRGIDSGSSGAFSMGVFTVPPPEGPHGAPNLSALSLSSCTSPLDPILLLSNPRSASSTISMMTCVPENQTMQTHQEVHDMITIGDAEGVPAKVDYMRHQCDVRLLVTYAIGLRDLSRNPVESSDYEEEPYKSFYTTFASRTKKEVTPSKQCLQREVTRRQMVQMCPNHGDFEPNKKATTIEDLKTFLKANPISDPEDIRFLVEEIHLYAGSVKRFMKGFGFLWRDARVNNKRPTPIVPQKIRVETKFQKPSSSKKQSVRYNNSTHVSHNGIKSIRTSSSNTASDAGQKLSRLKQEMPGMTASWLHAKTVVDNLAMELTGATTSNGTVSAEQADKLRNKLVANSLRLQEYEKKKKAYEEEIRRLEQTVNGNSVMRG